MAEEALVIYGILSDFNARGTIRLEELRSLVQDNLQLLPMYELILSIYTEIHDTQIFDKMKLDIQKIYECFETLRFTREIPRFLNGRLTSVNIKIVKTAIHLYSKQLLGVKEIKDACNIFQLREMELMTDGIPCDSTTINGVLWAINRTISQQVLDEWIKRCSDFLQVKNYIQAHEFLYLMANTLNRQEYYKRIPKQTMDLSKDQKYNLFMVDQTGFKTVKNPDATIQNYMNYQYSVDKATFEGRSLQDRSEHYQQKRLQKYQQFMKKKNPDVSDFKKILRDPELYQEIRTRLRNSQQLINHSKLNGKMLRVQLMEEVQQKSILLKEQPQYQKLQNRPISAAISSIREENDQHKHMIADSGFITQYMQRVSSAKTMHTRNVTVSKATLPENPQQRPLTAGLTTKRSRISSRPMTACKSNILTIFDNELSNFENANENAPVDGKFVFYGSSNSTQRLYNINLPWNKLQIY